MQLVHFNLENRVVVTALQGSYFLKTGYMGNQWKRDQNTSSSIFFSLELQIWHLYEPEGEEKALDISGYKEFTTQLWTANACS